MPCRSNTLQVLVTDEFMEYLKNPIICLQLLAEAASQHALFRKLENPLRKGSIFNHFLSFLKPLSHGQIEPVGLRSFPLNCVQTGGFCLARNLCGFSGWQDCSIQLLLSKTSAVNTKLSLNIGRKS